jgi:uncharacterized membrane protein YgcG
VISGASDFAAAFSVESILKILHDYDCADLEKFREKISEFPSATSTAILRANADVQAIKIKFAREFWLTSGKETVKVIARAKLAEVNFCTISSLTVAIDVSVSRVFLTFAFPSQLNEEENRKNIAASPEGLTSGEDSSNSGEGGSGGSSSSSGSSSDEDSNDGQASGRDGSSPKVDVTN